MQGGLLLIGACEVVLGHEADENEEFVVLHFFKARVVGVLD